jgi:hypothetical protein
MACPEQSVHRNAQSAASLIKTVRTVRSVTSVIVQPVRSPVVLAAAILEADTVAARAVAAVIAATPAAVQAAATVVARAVRAAILEAAVHAIHVLPVKVDSVAHVPAVHVKADSPVMVEPHVLHARVASLAHARAVHVKVASPVLVRNAKVVSRVMVRPAIPVLHARVALTHAQVRPAKVVHANRAHRVKVVFPVRHVKADSSVLSAANPAPLVLRAAVNLEVLVAVKIMGLAVRAETNKS